MHIRRKATVEKSVIVSEVIDAQHVPTVAEASSAFAQGTVGDRQ
jgi:hypothetical protein